MTTDGTYTDYEGEIRPHQYDCKGLGCSGCECDCHWPEHVKLRRAASESDRLVVTNFLEWIRENWPLTEWQEVDWQDEDGNVIDHALFPTTVTIEQVLARYYGINYQGFADEKERMFQVMRERGRG